MLEVGAQTHGTLKHDTLEDMKQLLSGVLDFVELANLNKLPELPPFEAFFYQEEIEFPTDENGMRLAVVHPTVCGNDFEAVKPGEPLLATFLGYDIHWQGEQETYPHFINEVAYSDSNIAMALAEKKLVIP
ncbi:probable aspartoacylase [Vibrio astriarenae]|nr:probable aspartoacylase [Vibrio sp. C7]